MSLNLEDRICLSENAMKVLGKRYLKRDVNGNPVETPQNMFFRVASTIANADAKYDASQEQVEFSTKTFYEFITQCRFMPNSPTLMNAGRDLGQLSACFVLPVEDSLESIFETVKNTALIHKSGGGTGFSFSRLRPKNDVVRSTMGVSSGPVSFMEVFNAATEAVKQGGTRRGANMGILRVDHPDILDFIKCKSDNSKLNNFNISVAITDKFMKALETSADYDLYHPNSKESVGKLNSRIVFDQIVDGAWKNGEPGIVFIDRINADNPTPLIGEIESTNPCGEVPLLAYEACNLGSINLGVMLKDNDTQIDWDKLAQTTRDAIHFLDNVITVNNYPLPTIAQMVENNRKIGLGVMGWADMLMKLGISYSCEQATTLAAQVMEFIDYHSKLESVELSKQRGRFNNFTGSIYDNKCFLYNKYKGKSAGMVSDEQWKQLDDAINTYGIRNATTTCIAPTGTISMIANCSGGIEPLFSLVFMRMVMDGTQMIEANPVFENYAKSHGFYSQDLMNTALADGTIKHRTDVDEKAKAIFVTSHDISPEWHIKMQSAFQLHTDNAVSKTINFEEHATRDDISSAYILAFKENLKGTTVYRNNSRTFQPMNLDAAKTPAESTEKIIEADLNRSGVELNQSIESESAELNTIQDAEICTDIKKHICPDCGKTVEFGEGCFICLDCGYSGCS